jgi:hypothetical protein
MFSTENWKRDAEEIANLMVLLEKYLHEAIQDYGGGRSQPVYNGRPLKAFPPSQGGWLTRLLRSQSG